MLNFYKSIHYYTIQKKIPRQNERFYIVYFLAFIVLYKKNPDIAPEELAITSTMSADL
jgi:hypothetical protein